MPHSTNSYLSIFLVLYNLIMLVATTDHGTSSQSSCLTRIHLVLLLRAVKKLRQVQFAWSENVIKQKRRYLAGYSLRKKLIARLFQLPVGLK
jgi:hypothetical protein